MSPHAASPGSLDDLDATAKLPVLDPTAVRQLESHRHEDFSGTDTWMLPVVNAAPPLAAAAAPTGTVAAGLDPQESSPTALAASLRETRELLTSKVARLEEVEKECQALRGANDAAEQRATQLQQQLEQARILASSSVERATQLQTALDEQLQRNQQHDAQLQQQRALVLREHASATGLHEDLDSERARALRLLEALQNAEGRRQLAAHALLDVRREADDQQQEVAHLARELAEREERLREQEDELARRATQLVERGKRQHELQAELERLRGGQAGVRVEPAPQSVPGESGADPARIQELETDLRAAQEAIQQLQSEARLQDERVQALHRERDHWRAQASGSYVSGVLAASRAAEDEPTPDTPVPEGATRLLVGTLSGREVARPLGRRTTIGRTPDNDLQIEASYISRHHAVILAGPVYTYIEDLGSTNGVLVNGQRVNRAKLADGDRVTIGRAHFRFTIRMP